MALIKCPECGKEISDKAESCPNCGCPIEKMEKTLIENDENGTSESQDVMELRENDKVPTKEERKSFSKKQKGILLIGCGVIVIALLVFLLTGNIRTYSTGKKLIQERKYGEAVQKFDKIKSYKDSEKLLEECNFQIALSNIKIGKYDEALSLLLQLKKTDKVEEAINECNYEKALLLIEDGKFSKAISLLEVTSYKKYEDSHLKLSEAKCLYAEQLLVEKEPEKALDVLSGINEPTEKSQELLIQVKYEIGLMYYQKEDIPKAIEYLTGLNYKDSEKIINDINENECGLEDFVTRYNNMMHELDRRGQIAVDLSFDSLKTGKVTLMSDAILSLNNDSLEKDVKVDISNFNFYLNDLDDYSLSFAMSELYATISAFDPDSTYDSVENIVSHILDDGQYDENGIHYVNYSEKGLLFIVGTRTE